MKASVKLTDGSIQKLTVPATVNSMMLTNHLSFVDDDDDTLLELCLSSTEWNMYLEVVTEIAKLEKETGKKFTPNLAFSQEIFGALEQAELEKYSKIADYMICQHLHDSLDIFIGSLFNLDRETILQAYHVTEQPEEKKRNCLNARKLVNDRLVAKAIEIVPELAGLDLSFTN